MLGSGWAHIDAPRHLFLVPFPRSGHTPQDLAWTWVTSPPAIHGQILELVWLGVRAQASPGASAIDTFDEGRGVTDDAWPCAMRTPGHEWSRLHPRYS